MKLIGTDENEKKMRACACNNAHYCPKIKLFDISDSKVPNPYVESVLVSEVDPSSDEDDE